MDRLQGKTKSGARCKRAAASGSRFCASHAAQADEAPRQAAPGEAAPGVEADRPGDPADTLVMLALAGACVVAILTLKRLFLLP